MTVVLAFGGNALLPDPFHPEGQEERVRELANAVRLLSASVGGLVLVHGNGPQVGMILLRVESTRERIPAEPLDVLVAETQGSVGYLLSRALRNAFVSQDLPADVTTVLTQVIVDPRDPAFRLPTKPIGPTYSAAEVGPLLKAGWALDEVEPERWRRVVPSPRPLHVVELDSIAEVARAGGLVVAGGGGGIPVMVDDRGEFQGVEAVVDKDRTAALLAVALEARAFVILTGVPHVARHHGTPREERIPTLTVSEGRAMIERGELPPGSMGPKVEALCDYVERTGLTGLITDAPSLERALAKEAGTRIVMDAG